MNTCVRQKGCCQQDLCGKTSACSKKCSTCVHCNSVCPEFAAEICSRLLKPLYVDNGCPKRRRCTLKKQLYHTQNSEAGYASGLPEARRRFDLYPDELQGKRRDRRSTGGALRGGCTKTSEFLLSASRHGYRRDQFCGRKTERKCIADNDVEKLQCYA